MDDPKSSLRLMEKRHKPYRARPESKLLTNDDEVLPTDFDTFTEWVEFCHERGLAVRMSEGQFIAAKRSASK